MFSSHTVKCIVNRFAYFAERLHGAIKGLGTKDRVLIRIIVIQCDTVLGYINQEYETKYGRTLMSDVSVNMS